MKHWAFLLGLLTLQACAQERPVLSEKTVITSPMRIVSLDYCADQYVLKLADPEQILAISPDAVKDFSYMREAAIGVATVRAVAEDVLILKPDLIVRSYGGGPNATAFFEQAGIPVLQVGFASTIDGDELGSIPRVISDVADGLGQPARGQALVAEFRARLAAVQAHAPKNKTALYMTPGGVTTGSGSLVHDMMIAAGLENFQESAGWQPVPLERLAYESPDLVAAAFFNTMARNATGWSASRHPIAKAQLSKDKLIPLEGAWTACGSWFLMDAIEALAEGPPS